MHKSQRRIPDVKILYASDGSDAIKGVISAFEAEHNAYGKEGYYQVLSCTRGNEAIKICSEQYPWIAVINDKLLDMSGYELAKRLRERQSIPACFIFLVEMGTPKFSEFEHEYFITKPLKLSDIEHCVRDIRLRGWGHPEANPVTHLPAGRRIEDKLADIVQEQDWSLVHVDVNVEEIIADIGFAAYDRILQFLADLIEETVDVYGTPEDFIGHIGSGEFIVVTYSRRSNAIMSELSLRFNTEVHQVYSSTTEKTLPFKLSMFGLEKKQGPFESRREIIDRIMELKQAG
jgi:CheY-like chemotaxis protein